MSTHRKQAIARRANRLSDALMAVVQLNYETRLFVGPKAAQLMRELITELAARHVEALERAASEPLDDDEQSYATNVSSSTN